ncbi:NAD(P)/FAD-dependent oxidoreductase [Pseudoroseomonas cervicalis]|uniref:NAD(P)/FAD-dependent oxidoreductase n=1 Tax=Teichococcus cervicalis TaxID=204525 RepID=UPI002783E605|nr:FAD-dependent oxidoreductase [Pseudoroseomonas cervicalis]MDQ1079492.1 NADH dehydrogenase FAD-containing subunit [Pseudoroseomonas cervicalis]
MHLVLAGAGLAHLEVLRRFALQGRLRGLASPLLLTLVTPEAAVLPAGLLPAVLAGRLPRASAELPLAPLLEQAGARWLRDRATGLDAERRLLLREGGPPLPYDLLSVNTGALPAPVPPGALPLRPVAPWLQRLESRGAGRIAVIGAGLAGVELALALARRPERPALLLLEAAPCLLPGLPPGFRARAEAALSRAGIAWRCGFVAEALEGGRLTGPAGEETEIALAIACTGARPALDLAGGGLACDAAGFPLVDASLRSISHPQIFVSGDAAGHALPRGGVWASRAAPYLAANLRRALRGAPLRQWPQAGLPPARPAPLPLTLLGTGDGRAIALWRGHVLEGRWIGWWKSWRDRRFLRRYRHARAWPQEGALPHAEPAAAPAAPPPDGPAQKTAPPAPPWAPGRVAERNGKRPPGATTPFLPRP